MTRITQAALPEIARRIPAPTYDRTSIRHGIVHIGVGGFHRAHEESYLDDLFERHGVRDWGVTGCGILPNDTGMRDALLAQDCLYTLVERDASGDRARVIGSLLNYHYALENPEPALEAMAAADTRIVSLTVTEGGYNTDHGTGEFVAGHPDIRHDLSHPDRPRTVFGYLAEALRRRRERGLSPFTILSCDNLQSNGDVAGKTMLAFAALRDPSLARWIEDNVAFPNSMVDRITPQTTDEHRALVREKFEVDDAWPVVCEPFRQWVIEDQFASGRPPFDLAGAQFVPDVHPYELMKIRLLNASHSAMGYLGYLAGYRYINDVIDDPAFRTYIRSMMDDEVTPLLPPVPGVDLAEYKKTLIHRFSNPAIRDQVLRICLDGSAKMPRFILPSIAEQLARGGPNRRLALCVAAWIRFLSGKDEEGFEIPIQDPAGAKLHEAAMAGGHDPRPVLALRDIFGDLGDSREFVAEVAALLKSLFEKGSRATLEALNGAHGTLRPG
jgi:mannitol 2-dehydrogenase